MNQLIRDVLDARVIVTDEIFEQVIEAIEIETWEEYVECAAFTAREDYHTAEHYVLGLATEAGELLDAHKKHRVYKKELDEINQMEEVGDLLWYAAGLYRLYGRRPGVGLKSGTDDLFSHACLIYFHASRALEAHYSLEALGGNHELLDVELTREQILENTDEILVLCGEILEVTGFDHGTCWTRNIKKLWRRYKGKFNEKSALIRDLEAERGVLEGQTPPSETSGGDTTS